MFHQCGTPVLVCPRVLRARGMGQCDLVRFFRRGYQLEIWEVKNYQAAQLSWGQRQRLKRSRIFIGKLLGATTLLRVIDRS